VPASVALAAYRIVQESLTNALRHSDASRADVRLRCELTALEIVVFNDGCRTPNGQPTAAGNGLIGMRERALSLGGEFSAGPVDLDGWLVHARLPYADVDQARA